MGKLRGASALELLDQLEDATLLSFQIDPSLSSALFELGYFDRSTDPPRRCLARVRVGGVLQMTHMRRDSAQSEYSKEPASIYAISVEDDSKRALFWRDRLEKLGARPPRTLVELILLGEAIGGFSPGSQEKGFSIVAQEVEVEVIPSGDPRIRFPAEIPSGDL